MWKLFTVLTLSACTYAVTEQDVKMEFVKLLMECNKSFIVDMNELVRLQRHMLPTKYETKCLLACAYKATEVMTPNGLYDLDKAYRIANMLKNGNETRFENGKKFADSCLKVNDVKVKDGERGCERAGMIFECYIINGPKFGFKF